MNEIWGHVIGVITLVLMLIFIGIWVWAWRPSHRRTCAAGAGLVSTAR